MEYGHLTAIIADGGRREMGEIVLVIVILGIAFALGCAIGRK